MKLLIALAVVVFGVWLWRTQRTPPGVGQPNPSTKATKDSPQEMVQCRQCGMHIPAAEAVVGRLGGYCSAEHRGHSET